MLSTYNTLCLINMELFKKIQVLMSLTNAGPPVTGENLADIVKIQMKFKLSQMSGKKF
jgi:hypothetical protein